MFSWKCFPKLLSNPQTIRMLGDVEVENASAIMRDQKETIQHTEPDRRNTEEVHCRNCFTMITKERFPSAAHVWFLGSAPHPARDRSLRQVKSKLQQFAMNTRRTPRWILSHHLENQFVQFPADALASTSNTATRTPRPIDSKSSSMPAHYRFRSDDHKVLLHSVHTLRTATQNNLSTRPSLSRRLRRFKTASC